MRLDILAALLLGPTTLPIAAQRRDLRPPDPGFLSYLLDWELIEIPYFNGNCLGELNLPAGRLRRVTWYQAPGIPGREDPPGWEKRVVMAFDDEGRCVEVEDWTVGELDSRRVYRPAQADHGDRVYTSLCVAEAIRDEAGRPIARLEYPPSPPGQHPFGAPRIIALWDYDHLGRLLRTRLRTTNPSDVYIPLPRSGLEEEFWYDPAGRLRTACSGSWPWEFSAAQYDYDANGRMILARTNSNGSSSDSEYAYDELGRLIRTCKSPANFGGLTSHFEYGPDGRLVSTLTLETAPVAGYPDESLVIQEQFFEGADRPLQLTIRDSAGRCLSRTRWSYANDARGNWYLKVPRSEVGRVNDFTIWRVIEYAD